MPEEIPVESIEDGMILARDAATEDGNVLLAVGTRLQARHSGLLGRRDIATVLVATDEADAALEPDPLLAATGGGEPDERLERVRTRLEHVFGEVREDPHMEILFQLALERAPRIADQV